MTPTTPTAAPSVSVEAEAIRHLLDVIHAGRFVPLANSEGLCQSVLDNAETALTALLANSAGAQPEPFCFYEPVSLKNFSERGHMPVYQKQLDDGIPLYTAPPPPVGELQGVSEAEVKVALRMLQEMWDYCDDISRKGRTFGATPALMREWSKSLAVVEALAQSCPSAQGGEGAVCPHCKGQGGGEEWIANENDRSGQSDYRGWINCADCNPNIPPAKHVAPVPAGVQGDAARLEKALKRTANMHNDLIVVMQAAWIEWKHGKGAEDALGWIENTLDGPGLIPDESEPWAKEAQAYFDKNRAEPFPECFCGKPSNQLWMGKGFCGEVHYKEHRATLDAQSTKGA